MSKKKLKKQLRLRTEEVLTVRRMNTTLNIQRMLAESDTSYWKSYAISLQMASKTAATNITFDEWEGS